MQNITRGWGSARREDTLGLQERDQLSEQQREDDEEGRTDNFPMDDLAPHRPSDPPSSGDPATRPQHTNDQTLDWQDPGRNGDTSLPADLSMSSTYDQTHDSLQLPRSGETSLISASAPETFEDRWAAKAQQEMLKTQAEEERHAKSRGQDLRNDLTPPWYDEATWNGPEPEDGQGPGHWKDRAPSGDGRCGSEGERADQRRDTDPWKETASQGFNDPPRLPHWKYHQRFVPGPNDDPQPGQFSGTQYPPRAKPMGAARPQLGLPPGSLPGAGPQRFTPAFSPSYVTPEMRSQCSSSVIVTQPGPGAAATGQTETNSPHVFLIVLTAFFAFLSIFVCLCTGLAAFFFAMQAQHKKGGGEPRAACQKLWISFTLIIVSIVISALSIYMITHHVFDPTPSTTPSY